MKKTIIKFLFQLFFFISFLYSNSQTLVFYDNFSGLKETQNQVLFQDNQSYLWIGTNNGLYRYDGSNFIEYTVEEGLSSNFVTSIFQDSKNQIWLGHQNGKISIYNKGKIKAFENNEQLANSPITSFCETNKIWFSSYGTGIYSYDGKKLNLINSENGLSDNSVYNLACTKTQVFAATDAGLCEIFSDGKIKVHSTQQGLKDNIVRKIAFTTSNELIVAMQDSGICKFDIKKELFYPITKNWNYGPIVSIYNDEDKKIILGTQSQGLYQIEGTKISLLSMDPKINGNQVNSIIKDHQKNIWLCGNKNLCKLNYARITSLNNELMLKPCSIFSVFCDSSENLIYTTGISIFYGNRKSMNEKNLIMDFNKEGNLEKNITCIYPQKDGNIWFGTLDSGLFLIDKKGKIIKSFNEKSGLANNSISNISIDKNQHIWVSSLGGGICEITKDKSTYILRNYGEKEGLKSAYVYSVFCDSRGRIWAGTDGSGLFCLIGAKFENFNNKYRMPYKSVFSITEDLDKNIWFSMSDYGINKISGNKIINYSTKNGLRDNNISILTHYKNRLFAIHSKGIDVLKPKENNFSNYKFLDNSVEPLLNSFSVSNNGNIFFGTNQGLFQFRAYDIMSDGLTPIVKLNSLLVEYKEFPLDSASEFNYNQNNFVFNFSAVWFGNPGEKIKFKYKLSGIDRRYIETINNSATYSGLPSGEYTFSISACNEEGEWSKDFIYTFKISDPFWKKSWFWIICISLVLIVFYFISQYRLRALKREKNILEHKVNQRTEELFKQNKVIEEKNKELEKLSIVARETDNAILIMEPDGKLVWVNYSFEKQNNISLNDLKKQKGETIFEISNHKNIRDIVSNCIAQKKVVTYETSVTINGIEHWHSSTLTPIYDKVGNLQYLAVIDSDITERKKNEEIIRQKNKDITDSIEYAKKIQNAILPDLEKISEQIPNNFVLFLQKDIVSGDFYWFSQKKDHLIIAALDCTGHGVPGAFMSMIGYNLLNQIINEKNIIEPGEILGELNKGVLNALYKNNASTKDGMDVAICTININTKEMRFSGAMRPIFMFNEEGFTEIKGDKISIGASVEVFGSNVTYTTKKWTIRSNDKYYIFTDGYADQFGGEDGKKMKTKVFKQKLEEICHLDFAEQKQILNNYHNSYRGDLEQVDDILVIGFSI